MSSIFKRRQPRLLHVLIHLFLVIQLSSSLAAGTFSNRTTMPVPCRPDQASALLRLKRSFNITVNSTCTLQSWRPGTDCCHWQGVSCGRASGRVTSLHLVLNFKANQLRGKLPHDIMQGCASEEMDFSDNQIEGQVPRSLLACRDLQVFDIGNNQITDNFPCWMSMLPKLQVLVLKSNKFFGEMGTPVLGKESNCEFTKLRVIDLASNNFSGTLQSKWFRSLQSMARKSSNDVVSMQYQHVTDGTRYQFNTAITYKGSEVVFSRILETLVVIDVSNNAFHGVIPKSIGELLLLCGINMSHNAFTGQIPAQFGALHQLESLDLSSNDLSGEIPQELAWLDFLSVLNLSYNGLVGNIPESPHFQTFNNLSFLGNIGLCGLPLSKECEKTNPNMVSHSLKKKSVDIILFLFVGLGFGVGFAVSVVVSVTWGSTIAKHLEMALPRGVVKYLVCRLV
ncbi:receptor-like protein 33 [Triticum dicoccoides]|uniref:receptor-like protein 33 n=1 Tax=Triticum dicoccoides TaxID=85692 RepID=UPI00188FAEC8|nr:receptor-like protein 33 [Triticum dicoccoides]